MGEMLGGDGDTEGQEIARRALVLWPRLNATLMRRCGGDPWGAIARLVSRRTFKISMKEYEDIGIKVGDRVTIEITKSDNNIYT